MLSSDGGRPAQLGPQTETEESEEERAHGLAIKAINKGTATA